MRKSIENNEIQLKNMFSPQVKSELKWKIRTQLLQDLLKQMIHYNPYERLTLTKALEHLYFQTGMM